MPGMHVKVSGAWKGVNKIYVKVSGSWKEVTNAYIRVSGVWKKFWDAASSVVVSIPGTFNASDSQTGTTATAEVAFNSDGTAYNGPNQLSPLGTWATPTGAGVGDDFWIRATVTSGALSSGTTGSWLQLSSNRSWTVARSFPGISSATVTFEIATDSGGSNIVDSGSGTLLAEYIE